MREDVWKQAERYRAAIQRRKRLRRVIGVLGCAAVLCTAISLMKPAITAETDEPTCNKAEHTHTTEECYTTTGEITWACEETLHQHTADCKDEDGTLTCGYADYYIHTHQEAYCCDEEGEIICPLEEVKTHTHDSACYDENGDLTCGKAQVIEHEEHNADCGCDEDDTLTCALPILLAHQHDGTCVTHVQELTCTEEEHTHTSECYETTDTNTDGDTNTTNDNETEDAADDTQDDSTEETYAVTSAETIAYYTELWNSMTDEEFVEWVTGGEHDDVLLAMQADIQNAENDDFETALSNRMDEIYENTGYDETGDALYKKVEAYLDALWGTNTESSTYATRTLTASSFFSFSDNNISYDSKTGVATISGGEYILGGNITLRNITKVTKSSGEGPSQEKGGAVNYIKITGAVTIDLNGYVLDGGGGTKGGQYCVLYVAAGGNLTIKDSNTDEQTHYGKVDDNNLWKWDDSVTSGDKIEGIEGGIITGGGINSNDANHQDKEYNSGIVVQAGTTAKAAGSVTLNGGTIAGNKQYNYYAGAGINCYGTLKINGSTSNTVRICYNYSEHNGGGIYAQGTVNINNAIIDSNYAADYGGGIRVSTQIDTSFTLKNSTVSNNKAGNDGGGVELSMGHDRQTSNTSKATSATFTNVTIQNNVATTGNGGGISMSEESNYGAAVTITEETGGTTTITENTAASGNGGGIYLEYGTVDIQAGTISNNTALSGGGVYVTADTTSTDTEDSNTETTTVNYKMTMSGGTITGNHATGNTTDGTGGDGGGFAVNDGTFTMTGGTISNNEANADGGGGYVEGGNVTLNGGTFDNNTAANNGGGLAVENKANSEETITVIAGPETSVAAGDEESGTTYPFQVTNNTATKGNGGGIYLNDANFDLNQALVSGNKAVYWETLDSTSYGNGGGIYVKNATATIKAGKVSDNECTRFGGGIYIWSPKEESTISGATIQGNRAAQCGGGVALYQSRATMKEGVLIDNNTATMGGGIYLRWSSELDMEDGTVSNNHAHTMEKDHTHEGSNSDFFTEISNRVNNNQKTSMTLQNSNLDSNPDYGGNGGGVYVLNSTLKMSNGYIEYNSATRNGGGIYALHKKGQNADNEENDHPVSITFSGGYIMKNTAEKHGGGVSMFVLDSSDTTASDATDSNTTTEVCEETSPCTAIVNDKAYIQGNEAANGGGLYVGGGKLTVTGGYILKNQATGKPASNVTTAYDPNKNIGVGGGIYVYKTGALYLNLTNTTTTTNGSGQTVGVYSNEAEFAADDVYCSPSSDSVISLPAVKDMDLTDYEHHRIGVAEAWYEDYPNGDTKYESRSKSSAGTTSADSASSTDDEKSASVVTKVAQATGLVALAADADTSGTSPIRYRTAKEAGDNDSIVEYTVNIGETVSVGGYACLTLGYKVTRTELTITKKVANADGEEITASNSAYHFTVTITGTVPAGDEAYADGTKHIFSQEGLTIYDVPDTDTEPGSATVTFSLQAGKSITLKGIPVDAKVTVTEWGSTADTYIAKYSLADGTALQTSDGDYTEVFLQGANTATEIHDTGGQSATIDKMTEDTSITCVNIGRYTLPNAGGSGPQAYVFSGAALSAFAVVCWVLRRRGA